MKLSERLRQNIWEMEESQRTQRREAADLLEECERGFKQIVDNCDKCGGTGNYIKHDGVSGKDLFYECGWCSDYREILARLRGETNA